MWVLGGYDTTNLLNDVWYSSNGTNWSLATGSAPWSKRAVTASLVYDSKMWVLGGEIATGDTNDVWWSTNGVNWVQATNKASWAGRYWGPASCSFLGHMWILGGNPNAGSPTNDAWYSTNGVEWTRASGNNPWIGRNGASAMTFNDAMWLIGGSAAPSGPLAHLNDIWFAPSLVVGMVVSAIDLTWYSQLNVSYQVQWSPSMSQPVWNNLGGIVIGNGSQMYVTDVIRDHSTRYYRVITVN
jgi:hypothetical protein